jgi:hypothetical protein
LLALFERHASIMRRVRHQGTGFASMLLGAVSAHCCATP